MSEVALNEDVTIPRNQKALPEGVRDESKSAAEYDTFARGPVASESKRRDGEGLFGRVD